MLKVKTCISCLTILFFVSPVFSYATEVESGQTITLSAAASDMDAHYDSEMDITCVPDNVTVTWTAVFQGTSTPAGVFRNGNTGTSVQWKAPVVCSDAQVQIIASGSNTSTTQFPDGPASDDKVITVKAANSNCSSIYENGTEGTWLNFDTSVLGDCSGLSPCSGVGGVQWYDSCGNHVEIKCCGGGGGGGLLGCAYRMIVNGQIIDKCIWETMGGNAWRYRTVNVNQCGLFALSEVRHVNQDMNCNEGCPNKSCARITYYDHITHGTSYFWRRVNCDNGEAWDTITDEWSGEACPGHPDEI